MPAGYQATTGQTATAAQHNDPLEDIENVLNEAVPIVKGGTGATSASAARTALDVQQLNANLTSLAGLTFAANKGLYTTGANTAALFDLTAAGLALLDDADAAAQRTTLGLGTAAVAPLLDEDDMASDSATGVPSQQSVAAFTSMRFIATANASDDATIDFTGFDATKYDAYLFVLMNVRPTTDGAVLYLRTSTDGGANYDSGASDYAYVWGSASASGISGGGDTSAAQVEILPGGVGNATGEHGVSGTIWVHGPHLAERTTLNGSTNLVTASGNLIDFRLSGVRSTNADVDAIRFLFSSGTIASGTITMYGLRNS